MAVAKNFEYVIEIVRAEGVSPWYTAAHDEFVLSMDGEVEVHLVKLADPDAVVDPESEGAHRIEGDPDGKKMGRIVLRRGHMAMLPVGAAYRFQANRAVHADDPDHRRTGDGPQMGRDLPALTQSAQRHEEFVMAMKEDCQQAAPARSPIRAACRSPRSSTSIPPTMSTGYKSFKAGSFSFRRDEYFADIDTPKGFHTMPVDAFLRALMRDVAWGFFYGTVNFDQVFGTTNYYGEVDMFLGATNEAYTSAGRDFVERFKSNELMGIFKQMISDWTNEGYDPFAAPMETGVPWGVKNGDNDEAVSRAARHRPPHGRPAGDTPIRTDANGYPVNRMFADVQQDAAGGLCRSPALSMRSRRSTCSAISRART